LTRLVEQRHCGTNSVCSYGLESAAYLKYLTTFGVFGVPHIVSKVERADSNDPYESFVPKVKVKVKVKKVCLEFWST